jgi:hypothetical protein
MTNGSGAAAVVSAGVGAFALATLAIAGDKSAAIARSLIFYKPAGPLSGVTTVAILIWGFTWGILDWRWRDNNVAAGRVYALALILLGLSFLLTFPPLADLL